MYKNLSLPLVTVVMLAGCSTVDLRPVTKPGNPRVVERTLIVSKAGPVPAQRPVKPMIPLTDDPRVGAGSGATASTELAVSTTAGTGAKAAVAANVAVPSKVEIVAKAPPQVQAQGVPTDAKPKSAVKAVPTFWEVKPTDVRLSVTFERWARESGESGKPYTVLWNAGQHVLIEAPTKYVGTFLEAVEQALKSPSILYSDYPLEACVYPNSPPVVRITRWSEQKRECPDYR